MASFFLRQINKRFGSSGDDDDVDILEILKNSAQYDSTTINNALDNLVQQGKSNPTTVFHSLPFLPLVLCSSNSNDTDGSRVVQQVINLMHCSIKIEVPGHASDSQKHNRDKIIHSNATILIDSSDSGNMFFNFLSACEDVYIKLDIYRFLQTLCRPVPGQAIRMRHAISSNVQILLKDIQPNTNPADFLRVEALVLLQNALIPNESLSNSTPEDITSLLTLSLNLTQTIDPSLKIVGQSPPPLTPSLLANLLLLISPTSPQSRMEDVLSSPAAIPVFKILDALGRNLGPLPFLSSFVFPSSHPSAAHQGPTTCAVVVCRLFASCLRRFIAISGNAEDFSLRIKFLTTLLALLSPILWSLSLQPCWRNSALLPTVPSSFSKSAANSATSLPSATPTMAPTFGAAKIDVTKQHQMFQKSLCSELIGAGMVEIVLAFTRMPCTDDIRTTAEDLRAASLHMDAARLHAFTKLPADARQKSIDLHEKLKSRLLLLLSSLGRDGLEPLVGGRLIHPSPPIVDHLTAEQFMFASAVAKERAVSIGGGAAGLVIQAPLAMLCGIMQSPDQPLKVRNSVCHLVSRLAANAPDLQSALCQTFAPSLCTNDQPVDVKTQVRTANTASASDMLRNLRAISSSAPPGRVILTIIDAVRTLADVELSGQHEGGGSRIANDLAKQNATEELHICLWFACASIRATLSNNTVTKLLAATMKTELEGGTNSNLHDRLLSCLISCLKIATHQLNATSGAVIRSNGDPANSSVARRLLEVRKEVRNVFQAKSFASSAIALFHTLTSWMVLPLAKTSYRELEGIQSVSACLLSSSSYLPELLEIIRNPPGDALAPLNSIPTWANDASVEIALRTAATLLVGQAVCVAFSPNAPALAKEAGASALRFLAHQPGLPALGNIIQAPETANLVFMKKSNDILQLQTPVDGGGDWRCETDSSPHEWMACLEESAETTLRTTCEMLPRELVRLYLANETASSSSANSTSASNGVDAATGEEVRKLKNLISLQNEELERLRTSSEAMRTELTKMASQVADADVAQLLVRLDTFRDLNLTLRNSLSALEVEHAESETRHQKEKSLLRGRLRECSQTMDGLAEALILAEDIEKRTQHKLLEAETKLAMIPTSQSPCVACVNYKVKSSELEIERDDLLSLVEEILTEVPGAREAFAIRLGGLNWKEMILKDMQKEMTEVKPADLHVQDTNVITSSRIEGNSLSVSSQRELMHGNALYQPQSSQTLIPQYSPHELRSVPSIHQTVSICPDTDDDVSADVMAFFKNEDEELQKQASPQSSGGQVTSSPSPPSSSHVVPPPPLSLANQSVAAISAQLTSSSHQKFQPTAFPPPPVSLFMPPPPPSLVPANSVANNLTTPPNISSLTTPPPPPVLFPSPPSNFGFVNNTPFPANFARSFPLPSLAPPANNPSQSHASSSIAQPLPPVAVASPPSSIHPAAPSVQVDQSHHIIGFSPATPIDERTHASPPQNLVKDEENVNNQFASFPPEVGSTFLLAPLPQVPSNSLRDEVISELTHATEEQKQFSATGFAPISEQNASSFFQELQGFQPV